MDNETLSRKVSILEGKIFVLLAFATGNFIATTGLVIAVLTFIR